MDVVHRFKSQNGQDILEVLHDQGKDIYQLRQYGYRYDEEEQASYEVRVLPDPQGKFGSYDIALAEVKRLLGSDYFSI